MKKGLYNKHARQGLFFSTPVVVCCKKRQGLLHTPMPEAASACYVCMPRARQHGLKTTQERRNLGAKGRRVGRQAEAHAHLEPMSGAALFLLRRRRPPPPPFADAGLPSPSSPSSSESLSPTCLTRNRHQI